MGYRVYSPALSASQPTAQTRIFKDLAEGRRLERLCPAGPWLSRPVGYQLPEPSGQKLQLGFRGNYRLGERHQERPAKSRYDRRPRLKKCRIYVYCTVNARFRQGAFVVRVVRADRASAQLRGGT